MAEFTRSRLARQSGDEQLTKKTLALGVVSMAILVLLVLFGLPLLIRFSVFLGSRQSRKDNVGETVLPPLPPRIILPFEATNSAKINIRGFAENGATVELLKDGQLLESMPVDNKGEFNFQEVVLSEGSNIFYATAYLKGELKSDPSKHFAVLYDTKAPELKLTNPSETSLTVDYADFDIIGKTETGCSVTINGSFAPVDSEGNFKLKVQLGAGKNEFEVKVKDQAGNETKTKTAITYDI